MIHKKDRMAWPLVALVAAAVILIVIFAVFPTAPKVASPANGRETPAQPNADQLRVSNVNVTPSPARGDRVAVKLAAQLQNAGNAAITGATVEASFSDDKGNTVFTQTQPIERITPQGSAEKETAFADKPLKPNDTAVFEVEFTGVPTTWNKRPPALRIVDVETNSKPQPIAESDTAPAVGADAADASKPSPATPKRTRAAKSGGKK